MTTDRPWYRSATPSAVLAALAAASLLIALALRISTGTVPSWPGGDLRFVTFVLALASLQLFGLATRTPPLPGSDAASRLLRRILPGADVEQPAPSPTEAGALGVAIWVGGLALLGVLAWFVIGLGMWMFGIAG